MARLNAPPAETQFLEVEGEELYDVEDILDERVSRGVGEFLVQWQGTDPSTGKPWDPTWEPKTSCSDQLITEWKRKKRKDPGIVGRWTREMQQRLKEEKKAKTGGKRKREGSSSTFSASHKSPKHAKTSAGKPASVGSTRTQRVSPAVSSQGRATRSTRATSSKRDIGPAPKPHPHGKKKAHGDPEETDEEDWSHRPSHENHPAGHTPSPKTNIKSKSKARDTERSAPDQEDEVGDKGEGRRPTRQSRQATPPAQDLLDQEASADQAAAPADMIDNEAGHSEKGGQSNPDASNNHNEGASRQPSSDAAEKARGPEENAPAASGTSKTLRPTRPLRSTRHDSSSKKAGTGETAMSPASKSKSSPRPKTRGQAPQAGPSVVSRLPVDSQTDGTESSIDKSIPMSQLDPITQFSSPPGTTKKTTHAQGVTSRLASQGTDNVSTNDTKSPAAVVVRKQIDGEEWILAEDESVPRSADIAAVQDAERGTLHVEVEGAMMEAADDDLDELRSPEMESRRLAPYPEHAVHTRLLAEKDASIADLSAQIAALNETLATLPVKERLEELTAAIAEKDKRLTELDLKVSQMELERANVPDPSVELTKLVAEKDARLAEKDVLAAEKDARLADLSKEVVTLSERLAVISAGVPADAQGYLAQLSEKKAQMELLIATVEEADQKSTKLQEELDAAQQQIETLSNDYTFIRTQYNTASDRAVEAVRRSSALQDEVEKLKEQLKTGLKQRSMHFEAIRKKREEETVRLRSQNKILLDQARLTDDAVRKKAALFEQYRLENERLKEEGQRWEMKYDALQQRNEELAEQNVVLRGQKMGVFGDEGDDDTDASWSEGDAEDDVTDQEGSLRILAETSTQLGKGTVDPRALMAHRALAVDVEESMGFSPSQIMPGESQFDLGPTAMLASPSAPGRDGHAEVGAQVTRQDHLADGRAEIQVDTVVDGGTGFLCKWHEGTEACQMMFDTHPALIEHARDHVWTKHQEGMRGL